MSKSTGMVLISALVLGLGNGMSNGWIQTVGADLAPEGFRPQFLGTWNLLMGIGTAVGPLAAVRLRNGSLWALARSLRRSWRWRCGLVRGGSGEETLPPVL